MPQKRWEGKLWSNSIMEQRVSKNEAFRQKEGSKFKDRNRPV